MAIIAPATPNIGDARGSGEVAVRNDLVALLAEFNGNIDDSNIKSGAGINGAKLGAGTVTPDRHSAGVVATGKSVIATSEARTNVAYGTLTTPDQVSSIVLPTDGVICVLFQATWQESVADTGRAAIFIGANQLKVASDINAGAVTQAGRTGSAATNRDTPLISHPLGLAGLNGNAYTGDVTTGQAIGVTLTTVGNLNQEINGTNKTLADSQVGGPCSIFAAAGTYVVSVQFKSSSGSVTVKNRRLLVWAMGF
jgi:hypothetical protein